MKFLLMLLLVGCTKAAPELPATVINVVPKNYDLNDPLFAHAKLELMELVAACGPGIIEGVEGKNTCSYKVKVDSLFMKHPADKTGFIHEEGWAYKDNVEWISPKREALPDAFDLRDVAKNGLNVPKQQQCGDCWAWATHHGLEIARAVHDSVLVDYSAQSVLSCSGAGSCGGGSMDAVSFLMHGLPLESEYPYLGGVTGRCKYTDNEITAGWPPKPIGTPYIGNSMSYSRGLMAADGTFASRPGVQEMMAAIYQWKSPLVVTVSAYSVSGNGVVSNCSAVNSGGNHMVTIIGWDHEGGTLNAHVYNSWGSGHGLNGVSRIKWECGAGNLNRGLGVEARVVQYKPACIPPVVDLGAAKHVMFSGEGNFVKLGSVRPDQKCEWTPSLGLSDPHSCMTYASPDKSTEYHLTATNDCASASAMTLVEVWGPKGKSPVLRTPAKDVTL